MIMRSVAHNRQTHKYVEAIANNYIRVADLTLEIEIYLLEL